MGERHLVDEDLDLAELHLMNRSQYRVEVRKSPTGPWEHLRQFSSAHKAHKCYESRKADYRYLRIINPNGGIRVQTI